MATLAVDQRRKRVTATLQGSAAVPGRTQWSVAPQGYAQLLPIGGGAANGLAVEVKPLQAGVVAVTATFFDGLGNQVGATDTPVTQDLQITGSDPETMGVAATGSAPTVPPAAGTGKPPTAAAGANNGGSPPAPGVAGVDTHGTVTFGSGSAPAAGAQVVVTFAAPRPNDHPDVVLGAGNDATQPLGLEATGITANGFTISTHAAPAAAQAVGTFAVEYEVSG